MPIPGYNGIDSTGILLSASNLTTLALSSDKSTVSVGPGNRWGTSTPIWHHQILQLSEGASGTLAYPAYF